jgi:chromosomal replication initiator protein
MAGKETSETGMPILNTPDYQAAWVRVRSRLRDEFGEAAFRNWLKPLALTRVDDGKAMLAAPSRFLRDWIASHYGDRLIETWRQEAAGIRGVVVEAPDVSDASAPSAVPPDMKPELSSDGFPAPRGSATDDYTAPLDGRFTFENFVVGKPNELAYAAARRVAEADTLPFKPLFLYGGVGLGKTHLMHALAWRIRERTPERKVVYISAERFMFEFIRAVRFKDTMAFKDRFRSVDVLLVDDIQFISGKESTQEEFFHTFNALVDRNRQVVFSADKSPVDLEGVEERLRSRLGWGLVADIHPTTFELRLSILETKAETLQQTIPQPVMEFLAHKITSNVRELEGALNRIAAHADLVKRHIDLEMAQDVLQDLLRANDRHVTIEEIQKKVCEHYNIRMADMHSPRRSRAVARPRQVAMYLAKLLTTRSLPDIGRKFGGRDHTTVMHAVKRIEELRTDDKTLDEDVELLRRMLSS